MLVVDLIQKSLEQARNKISGFIDKGEMTGEVELLSSVPQ